MSLWRTTRLLIVATSSLVVSHHAIASEAHWSGYAAGEYRRFASTPSDPQQDGHVLSLVLQPEYASTAEEGRESLVFSPFLRVDGQDSERTHGDIRELAWTKAWDKWEVRAGIRKVFWGVTESYHLVDIVNQTDLVEGLDGKEKLGQPMINLAAVNDWGTFDLFVLPYFRARTFPGVEGRLRFIPRVDPDLAVYESSRKKRHVDAAVRWSKSTGAWDVGFYYFAGTGREPRLVPGVDGQGDAVLIPYYDLIGQAGLDIQATMGSWLLKLEAIHRAGQGPGFYAAVGGFEYTIVGIAGTRADLGLVMEYLYDDRGWEAPPTAFQDDVMLGARLTLNDAQGTELLVSVISDRDGGTKLYGAEASRRINNHWKIGLKGRVFARVTSDDPLYSFRNDDFLQLRVAYYF